MKAPGNGFLTARNYLKKITSKKTRKQRNCDAVVETVANCALLTTTANSRKASAICILEFSGDYCNSFNWWKFRFQGIGPLQLTVTWYKNRHAGTQETHWDKTNKENYNFK